MNAAAPGELSEAQIGALLDLFYKRVRADPELGPVFAGAIADHEWPAHIANIQDFWPAVMLKSGRYKGNPFEVHKKIKGISPELFTRWLALFDNPAARCCRPDGRGDARARRADRQQFEGRTVLPPGARAERWICKQNSARRCSERCRTRSSPAIARQNHL